MKSIESNEVKVYISNQVATDLKELLQELAPEKVFLLMDSGSYQHCYHKIADLKEFIHPDRTIVIEQDEYHKNIEAVVKVWQFLSENSADRRSVLLTLAGGMPCDLGGFAASAFKRGIRFINIPTTLLAQVDASVGGKTGINFNGLKNEIGVFNQAEAVIVDSTFLTTLDHENILSGYAEMIKHTLIYSKESYSDVRQFDLQNVDLERLGELVGDSIRIKEHFVSADPLEKGIRKALNFGHTIGHAFESYAMEQNQPILHGYAVAYGMVLELYLSHQKCGFPLELMTEIENYIQSVYGKFSFDKSVYEHLYQLITHDKKNEKNQINFTLLADIGDIKINQHCTREEIYAVFDKYLNSK